MEGRRIPHIGGSVSIRKQMRKVVTSPKFDLSGTGSTEPLFYTTFPARILSIKAVYSEASSADAGVNISVGKVGDVDYLVDEVATEASKDIGYEKELTLLTDEVDAGTLITATSAGSKTGTGEVTFVLILEPRQK